MRAYVVKQGDYLTKLAFTLGFPADAVWNGKKGFEIANAILGKVNELVSEAQQATKEVTGAAPAADGAAP
mgnify:CR=1 FL=1